MFSVRFFLLLLSHCESVDDLCLICFLSSPSSGLMFIFANAIFNVWPHQMHWAKLAGSLAPSSYCACICEVMQSSNGGLSTKLILHLPPTHKLRRANRKFESKLVIYMQRELRKRRPSKHKHTRHTHRGKYVCISVLVCLLLLATFAESRIDGNTHFVCGFCVISAGFRDPPLPSPLLLHL